MIRTAIESHQNLAELLERLGDVPLERILTHPAPGAATESDVEEQLAGPDKRLCELVEGVLLEKAMGARESRVGGVAFWHLENYLEKNDVGIALPADGAIRLSPGLVYIPDVSFFSEAQLTDGDLPEAAIPDLFPDLAIEVISKGNTKAEMKRKLRDYFRAGTQIVWLIEPKKLVVDVYSSPKRYVRLTKEDELDGGNLLPGFRLPLKTLFARRKRKK